MNNIRFMEIAPDQKHELRMDAQSHFGTFEVKDDATLWQKVNKLAHSTYVGDQAEGSTPGYLPDGTTPLDPKKFIYPNNRKPIVTDDGILGSRTNYYLYTKTISFSTASTWKVTTRFIVPTRNALGSGGTLEYSVLSGDTTPIFAIVCGDTRLLRFAVGNGSSWFLQNIQGDTVLSKGAEYEVSLEFTGSAYNLYLNGSLEATAASSTKIIDTPLLIGVNRNAALPDSPNGKIDLKYLSVKLDEKLALTGVKTNADIIKPDAYTPSSSAISNDIINADGILDQLKGKGYITTSTLNIQQRMPFRLEFPWTKIANNNNGGCVLGSFDNDFLCVYTNDGGTIPYLVVDDNSTKTMLVFKDADNNSINWTPPTIGNNGLLILEFDGRMIYTLTYYRDGSTTVTGVGTVITELPLHYDSFHIADTNDACFRVDLNKVKFIQNGNVYQPCFKIPYIECKLGKKVVDKLYRDRVKDLFEQEGYNIYYTLGDDDFTLPSNKPNDIVKYKANGLTVAEQRVDQTLTIRGACEQGVDVNLPMEFFSADSYAVFGVGTTGINTASKFTPAADGNYIAIGKGKV